MPSLPLTNSISRLIVQSVRRYLPESILIREVAFLNHGDQESCKQNCLLLRVRRTCLSFETVYVCKTIITRLCT